MADADETRIENANGGPDATLIDGAAAASDTARPITVNSFRGWRVVEQMPTRGAEADIFIVDAAGARRALKLYRRQMEPKPEVLRRITDLSRRNSQFFVVFFESGFDETTGRWYELLEYMPGGSLADIPMETKRSRAFVPGLITEMAGAVHCLHENNLVHCDIKPSNFLVRAMEPLDLVLADFGISSILASDASQKMTRLKGTPMYWAPEAFSRAIGRPCDWWGVGMILLETLAGEHPFEGLSDSQIIRELTLGNVRVPDFLGPDWGMLIKGLLTKDDAKRWGYAEVMRWLGGARDIPVYYEQPGAHYGDGFKPFSFEGRDYFSVREVAAMLMSNENAWRTPADFLRYVRQWMENNNMFSEAGAIAEDARETTPEIALFRFVNTNVSAPFAYFGVEINAGTLRVILAHCLAGNASDTEREIARGLANGKISEFYAEYSKIRGGNEIFGAFLSFLRGLPSETEWVCGNEGLSPQRTETQWICLDAVLSPERYIWPKDIALGAPEKRMEFITSAGGVPVGKKISDDAEKRFALPLSLTSMFDAAASYKRGAEIFNRLNSQGLLIPKTHDANEIKKLPLPEYEALALTLCHNHTSANLGAIDFIAGSLREIERRHAAEAIVMREIIASVNEMKERKITGSDQNLLIVLSDLLRARQEIRGPGMIEYAIAAVVPAVILWIIRNLSQGTVFFRPFLMFSALLIGVGNLVFFIASGLAAQFFSNDAPRRGRYGRGDPFAALLAVIIVAPFIAVHEIFYGRPNSPLAALGGVLANAAPFFGAVSGIEAVYLYNSYNEKRKSLYVTRAISAFDEWRRENSGHYLKTMNEMNERKNTK